MCLDINTRKHPKRNFFVRWFLKEKAPHYKALKAKEDIPVYKILNQYQRSPYYEMYFGLGITYHVRMCGGKGSSITNGFHALTSESEVRKMIYTIRTFTGAHGFPGYASAYAAVIPAGSLYYLGTDGDIVSNAIIVLREYSVKEHEQLGFVGI